MVHSQKFPATSTPLSERLLDFALVTLRNVPREVSALDLPARVAWSVAHVATIARAGGDVVTPEDEARLTSATLARASE